jgi:DNA-binding protein Fis
MSAKEPADVESLTLAELQGNQAQVAKRLGIARGTVIEKLRKYGLK